MCMACEMGFWSMIDALSPEDRDRIMRQYEEAAREEAARFACDVPEDRQPPAAVPPEADEPKP